MANSYYSLDFDLGIVMNAVVFMELLFELMTNMYSLMSDRKTNVNISENTGQNDWNIIFNEGMILLSQVIYLIKMGMIYCEWETFFPNSCENLLIPSRSLNALMLITLGNSHFAAS